MVRPVLLLDVDGYLNPYAAKTPETPAHHGGYTVEHIETIRHFAEAHGAVS